MKSRWYRDNFLLFDGFGKIWIACLGQFWLENSFRLGIAHFGIVEFIFIYRAAKFGLILQRKLQDRIEFIDVTLSRALIDMVFHSLIFSSLVSFIGETIR